MAQQDPLKPLKHYLLSNPHLMKTLLAISLFTAFSLFYLSSSSSSLRRHVTAFQRENHPKTKTKPKTNLSHILFGIGASSETWAHRRHYTDLWWTPNLTRGHVWFDSDPPTRHDTNIPYRISADTSGFKYTNPYGSRAAIRMARILKEGFELGLNDIRWFVMEDDDTVFFTDNLVSVLGKYNHDEMYYVGSNSESVEQDVEHSYAVAYGGGGFAVSYPLAAALVGILDGCIDRYAAGYGSDFKVGGCVTEIGVPVTRELGFHQMDIRGSPFGLLSAHPLAPLVSLHHLDYIQPLFPGQNRVKSVKKLIQAYKTDPGRALQHTFCYDPTRNWSISVSWGYNVQLYPFLLTAKELSTPVQTFLTWGTWSQEPFTFNTRVMSLNPCERPIIFYFDGVKKLKNGDTLTRYKRSQLEKKGKCDDKSYALGYSVKGFNVSAAFFDPTIWDKAPRRQCCEMISGSDKLDGVIQVRIRSCNQGESVTPP